MDVVWDRPEPTGRAALTPLSRAAIVAAAIALADAGGLDAVSLRKVGAALDAGPMRLYGYVATKDELLDLMVDEVHTEIHIPAHTDWRAALGAWAHRTRAAALRHEWLVDLLGGRPALGPHALAVGEAVLAAAATRFPDIDDARRAVTTLRAYVNGAIRTEVGELRATRTSGLDTRDWQATNGPYLMRVLAEGNHPHVARLVADGTDDDPATAFATGLDIVLTGIALR
ncbi:TetR family transcriptional regulator [Pseudonocardia sulfidoxydans NBRC 16205]|uniref:TetR family transcriptional regulator n=1 Tax=Pseudonocardia sulfidoxydans NBRC 16205 TaxID=1223511 RepID=A0A511DPV3_9PSEU|nr:TetR/AcrR family transcriptional regulator C-terminal domain-containing protein [Pseudonocardia sulfidoxydans]GEL26377.1 TetR family transcriptional regulator [Pseudonocardia sulfidoxydans NBRC 16205]